MQASRSTRFAPVSFISGRASLQSASLQSASLQSASLQSASLLSASVLSASVPSASIQSTSLRSTTNRSAPHHSSYQNVSHHSLQNALRFAPPIAPRIASRQPTIAGDVLAVFVWAAIVPGFMWLGTVMGL